MPKAARLGFFVFKDDLWESEIGEGKCRQTCKFFDCFLNSSSVSRLLSCRNAVLRAVYINSITELISIGNFVVKLINIVVSDEKHGFEKVTKK